jgi:phage-related minor tail protein
MAQKRINGLTIAISADTSGVTAGLKDITSESISLSKQLKTVDALLDLDPKNTELLDTKQKLLAESIETTRKKLEALRGAQEDVKKAVASGKIGSEEYVAFQKELVQTEKRLKDLEGTADDTGKEEKQLADATKGAGKEMQTAEKDASGLGESLKNGLATGAKAAAAGVAAVTDAAAAVAVKLADTANEAADYGDNVDKMSQKLGLSAEAYQEWDFIMQHSGSDVDKMSASMKKLADAVQQPTKESTAAFEKLGISIEDAAKMSQEDLFAATITALQNMKSGTERTALANDLLGKSAMDLGALLNTSAEDTEAMRQQVRELGGVMSDDAVKSAAQFKDSLQNMKTAVGSVGREIGSSFMPSMTQMMDAFGGLIKGSDGAEEALQAGIDAFIDNLDKQAEQIVELADRLIPVFVEMITKNAPKLIEAALKIIQTLAEQLLKNLPMVLRAAMQIITAVVQGIAQALPDLIPVVIQIVMEIAEILTDPKTLMPLIRAAFDIINALIEGLLSPDSINAMIEMLPEVVSNLVDILLESLDLLLDAAVKIIEALCDYFFEPENVQKLIDTAIEIIAKICEGLLKALWKIGEAVGEIVDKIMECFGLGDYWEAGKNVIEQFMGGVKEKWNEMVSWFSEIGENIYDALHGNMEGAYTDESKVWYGPGPAMATGGIVSRPTRALIGENGAEMVLPLERNTEWMDMLAARIGTGVQIGEINVSVSGADGIDRVGDIIVQKIDEALRVYQIQQTRGIGGTAWK